MIEIYLLEQLLAFQESGTLSGASEKLHLSQPAISRSMQKLETLLGVPLFDRKKNKLSLNENGLLAAEYAARILDQEKDMVEQLRMFDRRRHTITMGSCAPAPITGLIPALSHFYADMTIASEIRNEEMLLSGLEDDTYQIIILTHPVDSDKYYVQKWKEEHLFIALPPAHPLASYEGLHLHDLNGQTMLLYSQIGFWHDLCLQKMPDTHFLIQNEYDALGELVLASALPAFTTDLIEYKEDKPLNRITVPVLDPEANVTYYCICKYRHPHKIASFLKQMKAD